MRRFRQPLILRLPFAMADRHFSLERVLAADPERPWAASWRMLPAFALSAPELRFARELMRRKRNLWLYRCNQRRWCGDFVVVDMSARPPRQQPVLVVELKSGAKLKLGGGGAGNQFENARLAVFELAHLEQAVTAPPAPTLVCGDGAAVLAWIAARDTAGMSRVSELG